MNPSSVRELWSKLASAGLTVGDMPQAGEAHTPWYVRVMLGIAGWIAAGFLLGFVGVGFEFVIKSKVASISVGVTVIAAAYAVFRAAPRNDFTSMFALAVSFSGQALMIFGVFGLFERHMTAAMPWAAIAVIEAVLAVAMPNFIHRAVSAFAAGLAFAYACEMSGAHAVPAGVIAAAVACVWLNEARLGKLHAIVTPIGYGLTLSFMQIEGAALLRNSAAMVFGPRVLPEASLWIREALVVAALLVSVGVLLKRTGWTPREPRTVLALVAAADGRIVAALTPSAIATYRRLDDGTPLAPNEILLRYRVRAGQIKFATNAFFFQEGTAKRYEEARYGEFRVAPDGELMLTGLRGKELQPL